MNSSSYAIEGTVDFTTMDVVVSASEQLQLRRAGLDNFRILLL